MDYARTSGGAEFTRNLGAQVRDNPLPVLLIGAGIGWLLLSNGNKATQAAGPVQPLPPQRMLPPPVPSSPSTRMHVVHQSSGPGMMERAAQTGAAVRDGVEQTANSVGSTIGQAASSVGGAISSAAGAVTGAIGAAASSASNAASSAAGRCPTRLPRRPARCPAWPAARPRPWARPMTPPAPMGMTPLMPRARACMRRRAT
ncbi:hypothetical protein ACFQU7_14700 [Pseudoroseomonas wenyumeiae]